MGQLEGWIGVVAVMLSYGVYGAFVKVRPWGFALFGAFVCFGSFFTSFIVFLAVGFPPFSIWGLFSGVFATISSFGSGIAVEMLGMGAGQAVWGSAIVCFSFILGVTVYNERPVSIILSILALLLLILAIVTAALAEDIAHWVQTVYQQWNHWTSSGAPSSWIWRQSSEHTLELPSTTKNNFQGEVHQPQNNSQGEVHQPQNNSQGEVHQPQSNSRRQPITTVLGVGVGAVIGFSTSLQLVPSRFGPKATNGVAYQWSIGVGMGVFGTLLLLTRYILVFFYGTKHFDRLVSNPETEATFQNILISQILTSRSPKGQKPRLGPEQAFWADALSAFLCGAVWAAGNTMALFATRELAFALSFPLSQTGIILSGAIGIIFFGEIPGRIARVVFCSGLCFSLAGAALLGTFGPRL